MKDTMSEETIYTLTAADVRRLAKHLDRAAEVLKRRARLADALTVAPDAREAFEDLRDIAAGFSFELDWALF